MVHLPDELISEILSPALKIDDTAFSSVDYRSPFGTLSAESTSAYLLVCKAWLRVATPLLYHVVVLRSKAQAQALADALKANPALGVFVKKLRVEGAYGTPMLGIMKAASGMTDIFLSFGFRAVDNSDGLCKGLKLVNPRWLIVSEAGMRKGNKSIVKLRDALAQAAAKWDRLIHFEISALYPNQLEFHDAYAAAIGSAQCLKHVIVHSSHAARWAYKHFRSPALESITIPEPIYDFEWDGLERAAEEIKGIIFRYEKRTMHEKYHPTNPEPPQFLPASDPEYVPMRGAPQEVRDAVWARIISHTIPDTTSSQRFNPLNIFLVSKDICRVASPVLYHCVAPSTPEALNNLARTLSSSPHLGSEIRSLDLRQVDSRSLRFLSSLKSASASAPDPHLGIAISRIFGCTNNLTRLSMDGVYTECSRRTRRLRSAPSLVRISWDALGVLGRTCGGTLVELGVEVQVQVQAREADAEPVSREVSGEVFGYFVKLRKLGWRSDAVFEVPEGDVQWKMGGLSELEEMYVWEAPSKTFSQFFAKIPLPALRHLTVEAPGALHGDLLAAFGAQLTSFDISLSYARSLADPEVEARNRVGVLVMCPNVEDLVLGYRCPDNARIVNGRPPTAAVFAPYVSEVDEGEHGEGEEEEDVGPTTSLKKLTFLLPPEIGGKAVHEAWRAFFDTFTTAILPHIPNLEEVVITGVVWPADARERAANTWVSGAKSLWVQQKGLGAKRIRVVDEQGQVWKPRLGEVPAE